MVKITLLKIEDDLLKIENLNELLFQDFNLDTVDYNPDTSLDADQIFALYNFSKTNYCLDILKQVSVNSLDYNLYDNTQHFNPNYLINVDTDTSIFFFQKISNALLKPKRILHLSDSRTKYEKIDSGKSLSIKEFPDAVYKKSEDILYFKTLNGLQKIFPSIDELYRDATDEEVSEFLKLDMIKCHENFSVSKVKTMNRKRIAQLHDKFKKYSKDDKQTLKIYLQKFSPELSFEDDKFKISNDQDLKSFIYGVDQRYYETEIGSEKRIANSIIVIK
ncbi:hypothetical protein [Lactococcus lactis]|uniref:Uncharacterized protein n=1 Tax=Lactococcus lactis TaxID=1358 RepID=A0AAW8UDG2_9LACT|nr:hypothetical protein [Lactococcus lactis]MDT2882037.1 hypothetical protein [Lactococcus lactis]MDT2946805.1 hypothetical protein [Lactococcus lactis]MDT2947624.1 hypothetical protein [Lactococcus lactis]